MDVNVVKSTAFEEIIKGAGVLLSEFDPTAPAIDNTKILFATSGGIKATAKMTTKDYAEDIDNAAKNMKGFKQLESWECMVSGTAASITTAGMALLGGAADEAGGKVTLRNNLALTDFKTLWFIVPKTKENTIAYVKLSNALSTGGIEIQTTDKEKGKYAFEFTGHYDDAAQDVVPFEYGEITVTPAP